MEKLNIAIADDNEKMVEILEKMIDGDKDLHLVGKAYNGEDICNIIREKEPDVVLLDIIMPKVDGLSVMERVMHDKEMKKQPSFFILSAVGQERITEDAFNLGADYYMPSLLTVDCCWTASNMCGRAPSAGAGKHRRSAPMRAPAITWNGIWRVM